MPHTESQLSGSSGFHSFTIPIKTKSDINKPSSTINPTPVDLPQTTTVTWSSSKKALPIIEKSNSNNPITLTKPRNFPSVSANQQSEQQIGNNFLSSTNSAMSTVAGPSVISAPSNPFSHSSASYSTGLSGNLGPHSNPSMTTSASANGGSNWNLSSSVFSYPNSSTNQSSNSASNNTQMSNPNTMSATTNNSAYQYQSSTGVAASAGGGAPGHHQHSNSLDASTNSGNPMYGSITGSNNPSFVNHRRVNTESAMSFPSNTTNVGQSSGTEQSGTQFPAGNFTSASKAVSLGPLRVHQFFPTAGEAGVPVTVLATVKAEWARQVGLQLISGIYGGNDSQAARNHGGSKFVLCFGSTDVETRTERSIGMGDSPFNTMTTLEGTSYMSNNANAKDLDLTILAHAPHYPGPQLHNPSQGGRVGIQIKLVGASLDPSLQELVNGLNVGEFTYWQVSPRANLKRPGDALLADQPGLRRPASFPAIGSQYNGGGNNTGTEEAKFLQQGGGTFPRSQTVGRLNENVQRRPGLGDVYGGLGRMASAQDLRSTDSMSTISTQTMQPGQYDMGYNNQSNQQYQNFVPGQQPPSESPSSSLRRSSMGFSSSGAGAGSDMSRPSSELPSYSIAKTQGDNNSGYTTTHSSTPQLIRSTQLLPNSPPSNMSQQSIAGYTHSYNPSISTSSSSSPPTDRSGLPIPSSQRASLEIHGNIQDMAVGWSHDEWRARRRLVQFWRKQEGTSIHAICKPILPEEYIPNSVVVSCIFWDVTNECYITSVDVIYLLEALVASRFNVEEKNRIRRNLEGLKPKTISKIAKSEDSKVNKIHEEFFKLVMSFPNPKPRHIEKDIKIFPWRVLGSALNKIISKYSAAPLVAAANMQYAAAGGMHPPPTNFQMHTPSMGGMGMEAHQQQQQQQQAQQRRFPSGLSIDVDASNASYTPNSSTPSNMMYQQQQQQQHQPQSQQPQQNSSLLVPPPSAPFGGGRGSISANSFGFGNYLTSSSPRKLSSSGGLPGSSTFNFSDFVVSPVAFGQTPLQQAQSLGNYPATPNQPSYHSSQDQQQHSSQQQQPHGGGNGGQASGLGMDLGNVYKPES